MSKFILKKSYVSMDLIIEDVFENVKDEEKLKNKTNYTENAIVIHKDLKETRGTIEEIDEKTYKARVKKVSDKNRTITTKDIKKD